MPYVKLGLWALWGSWAPVLCLLCRVGELALRKIFSLWTSMQSMYTLSLHYGLKMDYFLCKCLCLCGYVSTSLCSSVQILEALWIFFVLTSIACLLASLMPFLFYFILILSLFNSWPLSFPQNSYRLIKPILTVMTFLHLLQLHLSLSFPPPHTSLLALRCSFHQH